MTEHASRPLTINRIICSRGKARRQLNQLREKLSPQGDVVSEAGRQRTMELFGEALSPRAVVARICGDVARDGLSAVLAYTSQLDHRNLDQDRIRVNPTELREAHESADPEFLAAIRRTHANISEFQQCILNQDKLLVRDAFEGRVELRQRYLPLRRIGVCVPGGAAAYPSTLLMTVIPAQVAGVPEIAVVVPPTDVGGGAVDILATGHELGVTEVYRVGGAQAVAALAYGVAGIERVDKIVGPGNLFVALAKRHVYGEVDIDCMAGPSEVVVLADESARPDFVAADLISQAEHSPGSAVLITWLEPLLNAVERELAIQLAKLPRGDLARQSLEDYGALILARTAEEACELSDSLAPEHLHLSTRDPEATLQMVQNAGAIFLGHHTPVALGDYVAGPSHVLPTGGSARFDNGLCSNDFLKRSSVIRYNQAALRATAGDVRLLANSEGLTAHSNSVDIRLTQADSHTD
ncbi:MAG: histidinol dehydrogenase [Planctomycetaceae bacterium]